MTRKLLQIIFIWIALFSTASAETHPFDVTITYPLAANDPRNLHGYRIAAGYLPEALTWDKVQVYFDLSYGYWYVSGVNNYRSLSIYSIAPIVRYYFAKTSYLSPFAEASLGVSYLSRTHIGSRNLGMHFSFQDQIGLGFAFGAEQRLAISIGALHYSNGTLSSHNSGITLPFILNVSYRF